MSRPSDAGTAGQPRADQPGGTSQPSGRQHLMERHTAARLQRDQAALGSSQFRAAAEEVARIEIAIAALEEPEPRLP